MYREKYALNLKHEFPRIPFYADFWRWDEWGEKLMALHIGYEKVEPWPLKRIDTPDEKSRKAGLSPKAILRADKEAGIVQLDSETQLTGVPSEAWTYRLGNRSALEWILDQYKEKTPKDPRRCLSAPRSRSIDRAHARQARGQPRDRRRYDRRSFQIRLTLISIVRGSPRRSSMTPGGKVVRGCCFAAGRSSPSRSMP
jgi:hypothetical protein